MFFSNYSAANYKLLIEGIYIEGIWLINYLILQNMLVQTYEHYTNFSTQYKHLYDYRISRVTVSNTHTYLRL